MSFEKKNKRVEKKQRRKKKTLTTSSNSSEGETGGLSVSKEPPAFNGPELCESLPDVNGDTSCKNTQNPKQNQTKND